MATIEISFDSFKTLTLLRESEEDTFDAVIQRLLGGKPEPTPIQVPPAPPHSSGAVFKKVFLPDGTQLRASYKGQRHTASIQGGKWVDEQGNKQSSPSAAAWEITQTSVNGWFFWEAKLPNAADWQLLNSLRA